MREQDELAGRRAPDDVRPLALGTALPDAAPYATHCILAKFPGMLGFAKFHWDEARGRRATLIEYK